MRGMSMQLPKTLPASRRMTTCGRCSQYRFPPVGCCFHQTLSPLSPLSPMMITMIMAKCNIIINSNGMAMNMRTTMMIMMASATAAVAINDGAVVGVGTDVAADGASDAVDGVLVAPAAGASRGGWPVVARCAPPRQSAPDPSGTPSRRREARDPRAGPLHHARSVDLRRDRGPPLSCCRICPRPRVEREAPAGAHA